jgi:FAD/FMN-containing dehydrogenase
MIELIEALRAALPAKAILEATEDRAPFEVDWRKLSNHPALCVVLPETAEQVAAVIKLCRAAGVAVVPQGGNTGLVAGGVPVADRNQVVLSLRRMTAIRALDPVGDTITVEAGVTLQAVQEAATERRRIFPVSLGAEGTAQIGGVISTNAGGIQVLAYGSMRAQVLGLEVVLPDGQIWNGLRALRKDNTGFDLKQVFIGAEGTLGIITAATLRLYPAVAARATALVGMENLQAALEVFQTVRAAAGGRLTMCEYMARDAMVLGVAHIPDGRIPFTAAAYLLIEISATAPEDISEKLLEVLAPLLESGTATDAIIAQSDRERQELLRLREAIPDGEQVEGGAVKHDISVPISKIPETVAAIETLVAQKFPAFRLNIFGHVGDGNLHVNIRPPAGQTLTDIAARKAEITEAVEALAMAHQGSFSAEHGIGQLRLPGMAAHKSGVELQMMHALKNAFDPDDFLNPGKLLPPDS